MSSDRQLRPGKKGCALEDTTSFGSSFSSSEVDSHCAVDDPEETRQCHNISNSTARARAFSGRYAEAMRLVDALEPESNTVMVRRRIRDDLHKQGELSGKRKAAETSCRAPSCRLPPSYRARIVGWMRDVSDVLELGLSTLFAAVSLLDRFMAAVQDLPPDSLLQLLALACMSVAVKYNEATQIAPTVWLELAIGMDGRPLYTSKELQRFEVVLLQTVDWRLHEPNVHTFLAHFVSCVPSYASSGDCKAETTTCLSSSTASASTTPKDTLDTDGNRSAGCGGDSDDEMDIPAERSRSISTSIFNSSWKAHGAVNEVTEVVTEALALAELTLMYDDFTPYDPSTIALACVALGEHYVTSSQVLPPSTEAGTAPAQACGVECSGIVAAVVSAAGLRLSDLAFGMVPCEQLLRATVSSMVRPSSPPQQACKQVRDP